MIIAMTRLLYIFLLSLLTAGMAHAQQQSQAEVAATVAAKATVLGFDLARFNRMLDETAASLVDANPGLGADYPIWVIPSRVYPEMYSRDSFWTLAGYGRGTLLKQYVEIFSRNAQGSSWVPALAGQMPTFVRKNVPNPTDARTADESTMFWVLGAKLAGKTVADEPYLEAVHTWLASHVTAQGFLTTSHGWIDAWRTGELPVVSANNQGLYAVTLRALREAGAAVTATEIRAADDAYRSLAADGRLHAYLGSAIVDVSGLIGEALTLYFWNESILGGDVVTTTVDSFAQTFYRDGDFLGFKCLSHPNGSYLDPNDFIEAAERDVGNYQNGASWLLYDALALYAAARHDTARDGGKYAGLLVRRLKAEVKYQYSSKEHICTGGTCGGCTAARCVCPDNVCGVGSYHFGRSGYGWNAFVKLLVSPP